MFTTKKMCTLIAGYDSTDFANAMIDGSLISNTIAIILNVQSNLEYMIEKALIHS